MFLRWAPHIPAAFEESEYGGSATGAPTSRSSRDETPSTSAPVGATRALDREHSTLEPDREVRLNRPRMPRKEVVAEQAA